MAENSKIQWCDHTFNPWRGCTKVSPGCTHCYAETMSKRNPGTLGEWGPNGKRAVASESYWRQPHKWDREAKAAGERRRVFCASLADVFEERPELDNVYTGARQRLFCDTIMATPHLDWLLLTKRPQYMRAWFNWFPGYADQPNVWLGVSVEDQERADERIPHLLKTAARVRFLSVEPLLGPVDLNPWFWDAKGDCVPFRTPGIDWVIVGGESGPGARPCDVGWVRSVMEQCKAAGVACFVKQLGTIPADAVPWPNASEMMQGREYVRAGARDIGCVYLRDKKGGDMAEWPEDLRIREFPTLAKENV